MDMSVKESIQNATKKNILIIEDEDAIRDILTYSLREEGYQVFGASTGGEGLRLLERVRPDALLLDAMLPDADGFQLCRQISERDSIPILMITARDELVDRILGLELGADDYITKPFQLREVMARVRAMLRRRDKLARDKRIESNRLRLSDRIEVDRDRYAVYRDGCEVKLKPKEFELMLLFCDYPARVFSREEIVDHVWAMDYDGDLRTVDVHVQRIRKKLSTTIIDTVFGIGYKRGERI